MQETYPRSASRTEQVTLSIPFQESFPDNEGAKRVVVCQFNDTRAQSSFIGDGATGGAPRKFVVREDMTLVVSRIFGGYLKQVGFNVSFDDRLPEAGGEVVREVLKRHEADYLIAGNLEEMYCRSRMDTGRPVFVVAGLRLDIYNNEGRLRMYYPARLSDAEFLAEKADDPAEVSALLDRSIHNLFVRTFDDDFFVKALDLEPATVRELMKAKPAPTEPTPEEAKPEEAEPETPKPEETKPEEKKPEPAPKVEEPKKEPTEEEKAEQKRREAAKDLENAVKDTTTPKAP
jgi:cell division septation protein DedD